MYTVDYFIKKFEAIPEENWWVEYYHDESMKKFCALGHCGERGNGFPMSDEAACLTMLIHELDTIPSFVNDGYNVMYNQPTPKQRILAALYDIKANEAVKEAQSIVSTQLV